MWTLEDAAGSCLGSQFFGSASYQRGIGKRQ
jgi:hypothetical protein